MKCFAYRLPTERYTRRVISVLAYVSLCVAASAYGVEVRSKFSGVWLRVEPKYDTYGVAEAFFCGVEGTEDCTDEFRQELRVKEERNMQRRSRLPELVEIGMLNSAKVGAKVCRWTDVPNSSEIYGVEYEGIHTEIRCEGYKTIVISSSPTEDGVNIDFGGVSATYISKASSERIARERKESARESQLKDW